MRHGLLFALLCAATLSVGCKGTPKFGGAPAGANAPASVPGVVMPTQDNMKPVTTRPVLKANWVCLLCPDTVSEVPTACPRCGRTLLPIAIKKNLAKKGGPKVSVEIDLTPNLPGNK